MSAAEDDRPTFGTYWRTKEESSTAKSLVFVQSDPCQPNGKASSNTEESDQSAKNKRRAQVRKAQIQHRARKANYTKQLEADIAAIREQIDDAERDRRLLRTENQAIHAQLFGHGGPQGQAAECASSPSGGFIYTTTPSTSYLQDASAVKYGRLDVNESLSLNYFDVADAGSLNVMLGVPGGYHDDSSPACADSSRGSSEIYGSPQYVDSMNNTSYESLYGVNSQAQTRQEMHYMPGLP